ncbi:hypothetical protein LTR50_007400 [Elasticomyces elasticus]|nr:hypothetical protein LTR50_007400 [Elasticomyces elasticus]
MVSHPEQQYQMSHRTPSVTPSVASSRASTTRRHRHGRLHHGGGSSSQLAQNEFPLFTHTGDVEIVISSSNGQKEQRYLLHRLILSQCSGFFEAGTRDVWASAGFEQTTAGPQYASLSRIEESRVGGREVVRLRGSQDGAERKRWRYRLDWGSREPDEVPMLVQGDSAPSLFGGGEVYQPRPPPARNKPPTSHSGFFRGISGNFSALNISSQPSSTNLDDELLRDYDNLLRIMYNYAPALDAVNIANAYVECKTLLQLADMYDALEVVGPRVDHHLLRFQGRLFKQIAKYPPSYLKLGYLARSRVIFVESLIHVVGQWPAAAPQLRNAQIDSTVMELIEDKVDEMEELKSKVEGKLFRLTLTTSRGERVTPGNGWLDWMAMSLFRQWLAENTTPAPVPILKESTQAPLPSRGAPRSSSGNHHSTSASHTRPSAPTAPPPPPNAGRIYRLLGTGGSAYLPHDELKRFLKLSPENYTRENMKRFERRMEEVKNLARDAVKPLMRDFLELDAVREGAVLPYLTCTRVGDGEWPWEE